MEGERDGRGGGGKSIFKAAPIPLLSSCKISVYSPDKYIIIRGGDGLHLLGGMTQRGGGRKSPPPPIALLVHTEFTGQFSVFSDQWMHNREQVMHTVKPE